AVAVRFAREHDLLVSVRGAGHNIAGHAACDGGLMISLARMTGVSVDPEAGLAVVEPGATLADVDAATQAHGLAVPTGINSTTGISRLTLGGGVGWLGRTHGLTIDNLQSVEMVLASGERVEASSAQHPDLFWAIRGGGGNFGIVTSFTFQAHPIGPQVLSGLIVHPISDAPQVLRGYRDFVASVPDEATVWVVLRKAPPLPFLPEEVHGTEVLVLAAFYAGDMVEGERVFAPLRALGTPIADVIGPHEFSGWQQAFDPLLTPGARNYWKSHDFESLDDGLIDTVLQAVAELPDPQTEIFIGQLGGAQSRIREDATAYRGRGAAFLMNVHGRWDDPEQDRECVAWCRRVFDQASEFAMESAYVNFLTDEEGPRLASAYGDAWSRLREVKKRYDADNRFRVNQNIPPGD
ncbi:MAG: FAD-binding oxidoreductase, partial [Gemmatimonadetes bacterium]|nr:FAD-binding oxidoreductase [Gemmatimonadota bacterium]